jgi:hypothetical protein
VRRFVRQVRAAQVIHAVASKFSSDDYFAARTTINEPIESGIQPSRKLGRC